MMCSHMAHTHTIHNIRAWSVLLSPCNTHTQYTIFVFSVTHRSLHGPKLDFDDGVGRIQGEGKRSATSAAQRLYRVRRHESASHVEPLGADSRRAAHGCGCIRIHFCPAEGMAERDTSKVEKGLIGLHIGGWLRWNGLGLQCQKRLEREISPLGRSTYMCLDEHDSWEQVC